MTKYLECSSCKTDLYCGILGLQICHTCEHIDASNLLENHAMVQYAIGRYPPYSIVYKSPSEEVEEHPRPGSELGLLLQRLALTLVERTVEMAASGEVDNGLNLRDALVLARISYYEMIKIETER